MQYDSDYKQLLRVSYCAQCTCKEYYHTYCCPSCRQSPFLLQALRQWKTSAETKNRTWYNEIWVKQQVTK